MKIDSKFLIVGLGNPGDKYLNTRHNIGFLFLDYLQKEFNFNFKNSMRSELGIYKNDNKTLILQKPLTYMNLSGEAINLVKDYYDIPIPNIIICYDDKDIEIGKFKITVGRSPAGHNGIKNVLSQLKTNIFIKIRIGIGYDSRIPIDRYVLGNLKNDDLEKIKNNFQAMKEVIMKLTFDNFSLSKVMSLYNK